jgi:hypothetical protein
MKKNYKIKATKQLKLRLQPYLALAREAEQRYNKELYEIEKKMERATGIEDIEFFVSDGEIAGIGNAERTMELIHTWDLE